MNKFLWIKSFSFKEGLNTFVPTLITSKLILMGMVTEFKEFIAKGNAMDLTVGVIIGAAFGAIVTSLVQDVITPALLNPALKAAGVDKIADLQTEGGILYGKFLSAILSFLLIAFVVFLAVKGINKLKRKEEIAPAAGPSSTDVLLMEIRDSLKR